MASRNSSFIVEADIDVDVLVIGAGIAGTTAAHAAAARGARVAIACSGALFSGASFYASTWGLGLVGPRDEGDVDDFVATILEVGGGVCDELLARTLAEGVAGVVERLERLGVELLVPERPEEREYIPCFDHAPRSWRGLGRDSYRHAMEAALREAGVHVLESRVLIDLVHAGQKRADGIGKPEGGEISGALFWNTRTRAFELVSCGAVVLATGGIAGLFERSLMGPVVDGCAHGCALRHGARLVSIEFLQFMPTIVSPRAGIVFNEKTFRYARIEGLGDGAEELLELRSGHGPFTARLASREVDLAIARAGAEGIELVYDRLPSVLPEFVATYLGWLEEATGITPRDRLRIAHYAHAANGGIAIDADGATGVPGLFACGEATGGMHGADRIGGLSSANALVFGERAGAAAAERALGTDASSCRRVEVPASAVHDAPQEMSELKRIVSAALGPLRTEAGLLAAQDELTRLSERLRECGAALPYQRSLTARALADAALARTESLGSHCRLS